jgi:hypothetical protein
MGEAIEQFRDDVGSRQRGMSPVRFTLAAGVPQRVTLSGDYIHVHTAPESDLTVRFNDGEKVPMSQGLGFRRYYNQLEFESALGQPIIVLAGFGSVADARATYIQPGNALDSGQVQTAIADGATSQVIAADASRLYVLVKNPTSNSVSIFIGESDMDDTQGVELEPGETIPIPSTSAIFGRNRTGSGASATVSVLSVERI